MNLWIRMARCGLVVAGLIASSTRLTAQSPSDSDVQVHFNQLLGTGNLVQGQEMLKKRLETKPEDGQARLALGATQFMRSVERLAQTLYRYGAKPNGAVLPILRLPVPPNPNPEMVRYEDVRGMLQALHDDLAIAQKTLEPLSDKSVKLLMPLGQARLDTNGNGVAEPDELLWKIYLAVALGNRPSRDLPAQPQDIVVALDYADGLWLHGYCHLLMALCEVTLMYDQQKTFDYAASYLFAKPDQPDAIRVTRDTGVYQDYADLIAAIHVAVFPVKEPARGAKFLAHMQRVIELSRQTWDAIEAETDNDREWIPSPKQTCVFPQLQVTPAMVTTWRSFLSEAEDILQGKKLVPHYYLRSDLGINMRRVFMEPREFDLVLWIHGSAALPYAEKGSITSNATWSQFQRVFQGRFIGFAAWFN